MDLLGYIFLGFSLYLTSSVSGKGSEYVHLLNPNGHPAKTTCETLGYFSITQREECYVAYKTISDISDYGTYSGVLGCVDTNPNHCITNTNARRIYFVPDSCPVHAMKSDKVEGLICKIRTAECPEKCVEKYCAIANCDAENAAQLCPNKCAPTTTPVPVTSTTPVPVTSTTPAPVTSTTPDLESTTTLAPAPTTTPTVVFKFNETCCTNNGVPDQCMGLCREKTDRDVNVMYPIDQCEEHRNTIKDCMRIEWSELECRVLKLLPEDAYGDCGGEYALVDGEHVSWKPLFPVYKHVSMDRYVYYSGENWVCGEKEGLSTGTYYIPSGLKTYRPWEGKWKDGVTVTCVRAYVRGVAGSNACPAKSLAITSSADCEAAAAWFDIRFYRQDTWTVLPKGCFLKISNSKVYFNTHEKGNRDDGYGTICIQTGAYGMAENNENCPVGRIIATVSECKVASAALGREYFREHERYDRPAGCYGHTDVKNAYFNTIISGESTSPSGTTAGICKPV